MKGISVNSKNPSVCTILAEMGRYQKTNEIGRHQKYLLHHSLRKVGGAKDFSLYAILIKGGFRWE